MSINTEIQRISGNIAASYEACLEKGAEMPDALISDNLPDTIRSIQGGGGPISLVPIQLGSLTYSGEEQSPQWNGFDPEKLIMGGTLAGVNAGTYSAIWTPKPGFYWADDGSTGPRTSTWTIGRQTIEALPSQSGSLTYDESEQSPSWDNYDPEKLTTGGVTSATDAGTYNAEFTPTANYQWSGGSVEAVSVPWTIGKAAGSLSLSATSISLDIAKMSETITVTRAGDGAISAVSSNTGVAEVSVSGNVLTITGKGAGNVTVTVSVGESANYLAPDSHTVSVSYTLPSPVLNDNSWDVIRAVSDADKARTLWSEGDCKEVTLNGTVGSCTFSNFTCCVFIIGINHNPEYEGDKRIHFQFAKTALEGGTDMAFCDSSYNSVGSTAAFRMNLTNTNVGGWNSSYMRQSICGTSLTNYAGTFIAVIPADLRAVLKTVTKYTDNTGNASGSAEGNVTATIDIFFPLGEYEVFGTIVQGNTFEANYQQQYDYYAAGNSKIKHRHDYIITIVHWWLRSPYVRNVMEFVLALTSETVFRLNASDSIAFAPCFCV